MDESELFTLLAFAYTSDSKIATLRYTMSLNREEEDEVAMALQYFINSWSNCGNSIEFLVEECLISGECYAPSSSHF